MWIEPEQYRIVGACLAAARRRASLTQIEAAERLGRTQTFVSEFERGLRRVDVLEIILISRALDTDPLSLFAEIAKSTRITSKSSRPVQREAASVEILPDKGQHRFERPHRRAGTGQI